MVIKTKDNAKTSYQGVKFKFAHPILNKIVTETGSYLPNLNQMVNSVNQDDDLLIASKRIIISMRVIY